MAFRTDATLYCYWIIWEGEVDRSLAKRLLEFSAGLRVAEEKRQQPARTDSLLFVFSICVCLFTALMYEGKKKNPEVGGGGEKRRGDPSETTIEPFRRIFAERRQIVQENRCAFFN